MSTITTSSRQEIRRNQSETDHSAHHCIHRDSCLTSLTVVILVSSILIMIVVLQIPTVLFYNDPPSASTTIPSFGIDLETCSAVSCLCKVHNYTQLAIQLYIIQLACQPMYTPVALSIAIKRTNHTMQYNTLQCSIINTMIATSSYISHYTVYSEIYTAAI